MPSREEQIENIKRLEQIARIKEMEKLAVNKEPSMSSGEAFAHGTGTGLSMGFSDEIYGAAKSLSKGKDFKENYAKFRDEYRKVLSQAESENPVAYRAGDVGGTVASSFVPGFGAFNAVKGARLATNLGRAAAGGAVSALGHSNADLTKGDLAAAGKDVATGAALGAGFQGALSGVSKLFGKASPDSLRAIAQERAVKAATGENAGALRKIAGTTIQDAGDLARAQKQIERTGKDLLDEGVVSFGAKVEDLGPKISAKRKEIGAKIGEVGAKIDELVPDAVSGNRIAEGLKEYANNIPETIQGLKLKERILQEADNFERLGGLSFSKAQEIKNQFKFKPQDADALISNQDVTNKVNRIIGKEMDDTAAVIAAGADEISKDLLQQYGNLKGKYRSLKLAGNAATDRAIKNISNRFVSPSDYGVGAAAAAISAISSGGASIPALATGFVASAANKVARERGSSAVAVTLNKLADAMQKSPALAKEFGAFFLEAGTKGPNALILTHQALMNNPAYSKHFEDDNRSLKLPGR